MQTDFFRKKSWIAAVGCLLVLFVFSTVVYAAFLGRAQSVWLGQSFYFLLSNAEHVEAGAYDAQFNGGAGYLLEYGGNEYVVLSVYMKEEEGIAVQNSMADRAEILQIDVGRLYFKTCEEKRRATLYQSALHCLYGCMEVLDEEITVWRAEPPNNPLFAFSAFYGGNWNICLPPTRNLSPNMRRCANAQASS